MSLYLYVSFLNRWKDGELMHVHVSGPMHRSYEERVLAAIESYQKR